MIETTLRNATLSDLVALLRRQHDIKYDVVVDADALYYDTEGFMVVKDGTTEITPDGVGTVDARLRPMKIFEDHVAAKLGIPRKYLSKMRDSGELLLLANNVNTWLHHNGDQDRRWFVRGFLDDDGPGIARAFLSDRYQVIDNLDTLTAALDGMTKADTPTSIGKCNLTERSMYVEVEAPAVRMAAPSLIGDYRSPFTGNRGADNPIVFAGFVLSNSETGSGAFTITPRITIQVCNNGMQRSKDAMRKVHLGSRMSEGEIAWSDETRFHYGELVKNQVADAVHAFLSMEYLTSVVDELTVAGDRTLDRPSQTIERVTSELAYTEEEAQTVFDLFIRGGDDRAIGVVQAVTAMAQTVDDPDRANDIEADAFRALELAVRL